MQLPDWWRPGRPAQTVAQERHRPLERVLNHLLQGAAALGLPIGKCDPDSIVKAACKQAGLTDLGDDVPWRAGFEKGLEAARLPHMSELGRVTTRALYQRGVVNRLRLIELFKQRASLAEVPITRPIFVLGFPRTGTTVLQNLLTQLDGRRGVAFWELTRPVPDYRDLKASRKRRKRACDADLAIAYQTSPEMAYVHEIHSDTYEECWPLFVPSFRVMNFDLAHGHTTYGDWLVDQDMVWAYREYKRALQCIIEQTGGELVMKCPEHLWFVEALLTVFPDACIVWTHRDPFDVVSSYSSMVSIMRRTMFGHFEPWKVGPGMQQRLAQGVRRAMEQRDRINDESRFFDVDFRALVQDPIAMVRRITDHFQIPLSQAAEGRMQNWLSTKRKDARGRHVYSSTRYRIEADAIDRDFAEYQERFSIPRSARAT